MLQPAWVCDVGPAQEALGSPFTTSFERGARATMDWYKEEGWIKGS
jgi:nucleoside-diphosphate-sugar epimerase